MGLRTDIKPLPEASVLREYFGYEPETGRFFWKKVPNSFKRAKVGDDAGTYVRPPSGYRVVVFQGQNYYVHRLIWKIVTGDDPAEFIDHIDLDRTNNKWSNLRSATNQQNMRNGKLRRDNTSGAKGVYWEPSRQSWCAFIHRDGKPVRVGRFKVKSVAIAARLAVASEHYGEFHRAA